MIIQRMLLKILNFNLKIRLNAITFHSYISALLRVQFHAPSVSTSLRCTPVGPLFFWFARGLNNYLRLAHRTARDRIVGGRLLSLCSVRALQRRGKKSCNNTKRKTHKTVTGRPTSSAEPGEKNPYITTKKKSE